MEGEEPNALLEKILLLSTLDRPVAREPIRRVTAGSSDSAPI